MTNGDLIKSKGPFSQYENGSWDGSLSAFENNQSYKIKLANTNELKMTGTQVQEDQINIQINKGWNWLSYPVHRNMQIDEALAYFDPADGDVIKDQFNFAIYDDQAKEWTGTLSYLQAHKGYMLKATNAQVFNYPNVDYVSKLGAFA